MSACDICGNITDRGCYATREQRFICVLCYVRGYAKTHLHEKQGHAVPEKRKHARVVTSRDVTVDMYGGAHDIACTRNVVNLGKGGMCIEWERCSDCRGYTEGSVHPDCILNRYFKGTPDSHEILFQMELPNSNEMIGFHGKVAYTFKYDDKEKIGIVFTDISDKTLRKLERVFGL